VVRYLLSRFIVLLVSLLGASVIAFFSLALLQGDPIAAQLGDGATPEAVEALRRQLGLDRPLIVQYVEWLVGMFTGDLGVSLVSGAPVGPQIISRLPVTIPLALFALVLALGFAVPTGVYAAVYRKSWLGSIIAAGSQLGIAIPSFWLGIMLSFFVSVRMGWLPAGGFTPWSENWILSLRSLILPATSLAVIRGAVLTRWVRSSILEVMQEDMIRTARAKGLTWRQALWRHGLKNAAIPIVTVLGIQFALLVGGTIVIESVFFIPGIGRMMLTGVTGRDFVLVRSATMVLATIILVLNFLVDLLYSVLDPRLRKS
jgi:peptide/nickel transport system permease protein